MIVNIKESNIIEPKKETPKTLLWVSDLDLVVPTGYVPTLYFYKPLQEPNTNVSSDFFDAKALKDALGEVIVPFYPAAGRLGTDENGRTCIDCNGYGVLFVEAEATCVIDDFGDFIPCPKMQHLIPNIDSLDDSSKPLFAAQLTRFKCGSVCLGVMFHHVVVDGMSAIHFINSWSDITRGKSIDIPPFIDRTLLDARDPPKPAFHHTEYDPPPTLKTPCTSEPTIAEQLRITPDQLSALKSKFTNSTTGTTYSTIEVLAAHIWYCMCKARDLPPDQETKMFIPTDGRLRLNPPIPEGFFGNVQFTTTVMSTCGEVLSAPLDQTMQKIRCALKKRDDGYLRSGIDYLRQQPDLTAVRRGPHAFKCPNLNVVSWVKLPLYEADFGWGKPVHMGRAKIGYEGATHILPSPNNDRNLFLFVYLPADQIESFAKYFYDF